MAGTKVGSLNEILASRSRATFAHRVNFSLVPLHNIDAMRSWCEDNCCDLWRCESYHALYFQFADERDAMMFMLKWATAEGNELR